MATPKQDIDLSRYLDKDGVRIDARRLDQALSQAPETLKYYFMDALDHIRKGFFKALYANTGLKDKRFVATKRVGIGRQIRVYRNPRKGDILDIEMGIFTRSKITAILETGGTIHAKSGLMAVPIGRALSSTGRLSQELSEFRNYRRTFTPAAANALTLSGKGSGFFMLSKGGRMFLMRKEGEKVEPYFVLKNQVRIQPRLRLVDTWDRMEGYRMEILNESVAKALDSQGLGDKSRRV